MVNLYMDVHIQETITLALRVRGVDVLTAQEDGRATLEDPDLLDRAGSLGRVLVTYDKHFLVEAAKRQAAEIMFAGIIFGPQDAALIGRYIEDLELIAHAEELRDYVNRLQHIPL